MVNPRKNESFESRDIVPVPGDYQRPALPEAYLGDYYYGRTVSKSAVARSYIQLFFRQRKVMIGTFLVMLCIGLLWIFTRPTLYRSTAEMLVTPIGDTSSGNENLAQNIGTMTRVRSVATEIRLLNSPDLLDEAFASLPNSFRRKGFGTAALSLARYPVNIGNPRDTDVITVEVTAKDPVAAARFANQILQTNLARSQETTMRIAELATQHVDSELAKCDGDLRNALSNLAQVKQGQGVVDVSAQAAADAQALASLESQATQARSELVRAQVSRQMLEKELRQTSTTVVSSVTTSDNPVLQTITNEIERLQQQRAALLQEYLPNSPEVHSIDQQLVEARKRMAEAMQSRVAQTTNNRNPLLDKLQENYINTIVAEQESASRASITQAQANAVRARMATLPKAEETIALLTSQIAELQNTHAYLTNQKQALMLSMHGGLPNTMPITTAKVNRTPFSPNIPASLLLLTVIAVLVAVGIGVIRDQLDDRIHTTDSLESLTGRRVLTSLPRVENGMNGLVTDAECPPALLESFRILRGNILLSALEPLPRVMMVSSAKAGEGKSTTVANLAATIAMSGKRVLIIDCDMRHPSIHQIYDIENDAGLSTLLSAHDGAMETFIQQSAVDGIDILPAGPTPNRPPELLAAAKMRTLLDAAAAEYDCVLLDSPPIVNLSDGAVLASLVDGVLLVVASEETRNADLQTAIRSLEHVGTPILGLVYNRSSDSPTIEWKHDS